MKKAVVLIGVGEMGGVFAKALLRSGHPVFPVTRATDINALAEQLPEPELVLDAVAEGDFRASIDTMPETWKSRLVLLQNELLPQDFADIPGVTVISVWFEKKPGMDAKVIVPSPVYGPRSSQIAEALNGIGIAVRELGSAEMLEFELVVKNLYILTSNIAGLRVGGNVGELWENHRDFATAVANDVIDIQEGLTGSTYHREALLNTMVDAFNGDLNHGCMGRSAPARLARAIEHADSLGLEVPTLREIAAEQAS